MCEKKFPNVKIDIRDYYKFCDVRPMFGHIFSDWFAGYDFWGGCDLDILLGDIRHYVTDEVLRNYDKILTRDHFYLYRNTEEVNTRFMSKVHGKEDFYKQVLSDYKLYCFGERKPWGLYSIYRENKFTMFDEPIDIDIFYKRKNFILTRERHMREKRQIFMWKKGKIYRILHINGKIIEEEFLYIHLQKRYMKMELKNKNSTQFLIIPNKFIELHGDLDRALVNKYGKRQIFYVDMLRFAYKRLKKPASEIFYQSEGRGTKGV